MWQSARSSDEAILRAASTLLRNGLSSFHLDGVRLATSHCGLTCHPVLNFCSHGHESLFYISSIFGTGLQEWDAYLISKSLSSLVVNNLFGGQVRLVAHKQLVHILTSISVNLIQPLLHIVETLLVCDIIDHLQ
jgi:hypothetical protein